MIKYLLLSILFLLSLVIQAQNVFISVQDGDWNDASTWSLGAGVGGTEGIDFPAASDLVTIDHHVIINTPNSGTNFSFTGTLTINANDTLESQVGDNIAGFTLEGDGLMINNGSFFTLDVSEEPDENAKIPYEFICRGNSVFIGGVNSFAFISDDWNIQENASVFIDNLNCYAVSDDVVLDGTNCNIYGEGNIRIGGDGVNSNVEFVGGASAAQLDDDVTIWRNVVAVTCGLPGTAITTGTNPNNIPPFAFDDNFTTGINTSQNQVVLTQGNKKDFSPVIGDVLTITSAGSNAAANNGSTSGGGTVSVSNNGTPLDPSDDFIIYTPATGFVGLDTYNYLITNNGLATDIAQVTVSVTSCGARFVQDTTFIPIQSTSNNIGVTPNPGFEANLTGAPNGSVAEWFEGGDIINLDFGQIFTEGTQYRITWKLQSGTNTAQPVIRESTTNGSFIGLSAVYTITSATMQQVIVTSERDFRYLQITKDNAIDGTDFEIDAIEILDIDCLPDNDEDGIIDEDDIDDDNDGILDEVEELSCRGFLNFEFYDGTPSASTVDNIPTTGALLTGNTNDFDVDAIQLAADPGDSETYGIRYSGFITITTSETYTFFTGSDDGSKLFIGATEVVDNDGTHAFVEQSGTITLTPGGYPITVLFFENTGDDNLTVSYSSASISKRPIPFSVFSVAGSGCDSDNDGIINIFDLDSDNDGIPDIIESGGVDLDNNGIVDNFVDTDNDGWANTFDADNGGVSLADLDSDADGINNRVDIDSDNDGIVDVIEAQLSSASPILPVGSDVDNDGIDDAFDLGSNLLIPTNTDGIDNPDYIDTDSDNDGYSDLLEAYDTDNNDTPNLLPSGIDSDLDGLDDNFDLVSGSNSTTNVTNNGQTSNSFPNLDQVTTAERDWREFLDTDGDGISNFSDIDSDNDGILNVDENASCIGAGSGSLNYEFYDAVPSGFKFANIPTTGALSVGTINTFNVGTLQNLVDPGDADVYSIRYTGFISISTSETYTFFTTSDDGSGLFINGSLVVDNDDLHGNRERSGTVALTPGTYAITVVFFENSGGANLTVSYQTPTISKRAVPFSVLSDISSCDSDNDGIDNYLDLDSDNDGIPDIIEAGGVDLDNDGRVDDDTDTDNDGWADTFDADNGGTALSDDDQDGDGRLNRVDLDADNDGIADVIEAGGIDTDNNGEQDGSDTDFNGWSDNVDGNNGGTALSVINSDGDNFQNYLDIDSDNDGIIDNVEGQSTTAFLAPLGVDTDNDGWDNRYDSDNGGTAITINNQESAGNPDYTDLDTDGDGQPDWIEGFDDDVSGASPDGDALNDFLARATAFAAAGGNSGFYNNALDGDSDGIPNWIEDTDLDGQPNFLDPDSPFYRDTDNDGLIDLYDTDNFGVPSSLPNKDGDLEPDWRDGDNSTTLPITLLTFEAEKKVKDVLLTWVTLSEINNDYFTIEKSMGGVNFEEVATVNGAGNSNEELTYRLVDASPYNGLSYYRLKQTDFNGEFTYSELRAVEFNGIDLVEESKLYPNPTDGDQLFFNFFSEEIGDLELHIRSIQGELISTRILKLDGLSANYEMELLEGIHLSKGTYVLMYILNGRVVGSDQFVIK